MKGQSDIGPLPVLVSARPGVPLTGAPMHSWVVPITVMIRSLRILALCLLGIPLHAEVTLPGIFADHMVLQQGMTLPVWGKAAPGERVSVLIGSRSGSVTADAAGNWRVTLRPLPLTGEPLLLIVNGERNRLEIRDVLAGDVWICAGEGNMALPLSDAEGARQRNVQDPGMRFFVHGRHGAADRWLTLSPENEPLISAVGFFFARDIRASRHLPVGIVQCTKDQAAITEWLPSAGRSSAFGSLVRPILPFAMTGVLWYQGESDEGERALQYRRLLPRLVREWRSLWGEGPFPFYAVLPAGFGGTDGPAVEPYVGPAGTVSRALPWLREGVLGLASLPMTGVASAVDLGDPDDRHPADKSDVGRRLARLARHRTYGEEITDSGPLFRSLRVEEGRLRLSFASTAGGLVAGLPPSQSPNGFPAVPSSLRGFAVAGSDGRWYPAEAVIEGDSVVLSSRAVKEPLEARYDWKGYPDGNLYNRDGLPALPFRSDEQSQPR